MASPKILIQIFLTGSKILGKAFFEAGRQAVKNAKQTPQGVMGNDVAGVGHATSGSMTDQITRAHRMTLDEAHLILNIKRGEEMEQVIKNYEHLFKANSPPAPSKPATPPTGKQVTPPSNSHYLQSKVVRARERIEAELEIANKPAAAEAPVESGHPSPPPPPPPPSEAPGSKAP